MGHEFKICKELGALTTTLGEWQSIAQIINSTLPKSDFLSKFNVMHDSLLGCYQVIIDSIRPIYELNNYEAFIKDFPTISKEYQSSFLEFASKPRHFTESAHNHYIELSTLKEIKTGYPILKRTFENLYQFMDKWVTNDAWIVMGCDVILKSLNQLLIEISNFLKMDKDDAWLLFNTTSGNIRLQIDRLSQQLDLQLGRQS